MSFDNFVLPNVFLIIIAGNNKIYAISYEAEILSVDRRLQNTNLSKFLP